MVDTYISETINTITTSGTFGYSITCIAAGITLIMLTCMLYSVYQYLCKSWERADKRAEIKDRKLHNEVYLDGHYTAYKAGLVNKEADENGIKMMYNKTEEENTLITKLNGDVSENLTN